MCATFYNCKKFTCTRARHAKYQIFFCELKALVTTNDKVHTVNSAYPWHALEDVEEFLPPSSWPANPRPSDWLDNCQRIDHTHHSV